MAIREDIYYWKSDRPHATGNLQRNAGVNMTDLTLQLSDYLADFFQSQDFVLTPANGQGNHITYTARLGETVYFIRLENGPERDDYMDVESDIMHRLRKLGIPCPTVFLSDSTRQHVPFAIQVMEHIACPNLTRLNPDTESLLRLAENIGMYIAGWQTIRTEKFGLFSPATLAHDNILCGFHDSYHRYFHLNLDKHLSFLFTAGFLSDKQVREIQTVIDTNSDLLELDKGCLVHKDLAFWNILGDASRIHAFIDWDDAISGDPVDDLSLLACFHSGPLLLHAIDGYKKACTEFPLQFERRFWLHLLRNMIFKSVIRVRGKYFDIKDEFFLLDKPDQDLRTFTLNRIHSACAGLKGLKNIQEL